ncbi:MAG TPA: DALR anticodon-binding domain-containing protein, partial [Limnochordales bacterium]
ELYGGRLPRSAGELAEAVGEFLRQRLRVLLGEQGLDAAVVEAALAVAGDRPAEAAERARQLQALLGEPFFEDAQTAFQRAYRLARVHQPTGRLEVALLQEPMEQALWQEVQRLVPQVQEAVARGELARAVQLLAGVRPVVDRFFDEVLVMAEDGRVRVNRLELLHRLLRAFREVADFAALAS